MPTIAVTVDSDAFVRLFATLESHLDMLVERVAEDFADTIASEAASSSSRLGAAWDVEGAGGTERHVKAPEWWAHFLAGGTQPHGPASATKLVFSVGGQMVFASFVRGIPGSHFDERAVARMPSRVDDIFRRLIAA